MPYPMKTKVLYDHRPEREETLKRIKDTLVQAKADLYWAGDEAAALLVHKAIEEIDISLAMIDSQRASAQPQPDEGLD